LNRPIAVRLRGVHARAGRVDLDDPAEPERGSFGVSARGRTAPGLPVPTAVGGRDDGRAFDTTKKADQG